MSLLPIVNLCTLVLSHCTQPVAAGLMDFRCLCVCLWGYRLTYWSLTLPDINYLIDFFKFFFYFVCNVLAQKNFKTLSLNSMELGNVLFTLSIVHVCRHLNFKHYIHLHVFISRWKFIACLSVDIILILSFCTFPSSMLFKESVLKVFWARTLQTSFYSLNYIIILIIWLYNTG